MTLATEHLHFYDAANSHNIGSGHAAAFYVNGSFAWSQSEIERMCLVFGVSVERSRTWAQMARCIDVERFAALPVDAPAFCEERRSYLQHKFVNHVIDDATVYVNRSNWPTVVEDFINEKLTQPRYWVATLDGDMHPVCEGHPDIHPWAVQYATVLGKDISILYGKNDLHNP